MNVNRARRCLLSALALPLALGPGCQPKTADTPATPAGSTAASAPISGVIPADGPASAAASDRPGVPAIGAVEAGQAGGGAAVGTRSEPTAGDGAASAASGPR